MKQKLSTIALKNLFTFIFISATISGLTFGEDIYVGNDYPMHIENDTAYSDVLQSDSDSIIITNLQVASGEPYEVIYDGLHEGAPVYIDRDYTITGYPESLEGAVYIKTANDDKYRVEVDFLSFEVDRDVTVYVAHDPRIVEKPDWLNEFTDIGDELVTSDTVFSIFSNDFSAGVVTLGGNAGHYVSSMYIVIVVPHLSLPPEIHSVEPDRGRNNYPTDITIHGDNYEPTPKVGFYGGGPFIIGSVDTGAESRRVYVSDNYAYVTAGSGLRVIDISDPTNPTIVGSADTPGDARGVCVSGNYAYVADGDSGFQVIDISLPTNPTIVGSTDTPGVAQGVSVLGNYAYVADDVGLLVIDTTDPSNPIIAGSAGTPGAARDVHVLGKYGYVADGDSGLQVIDISDPLNPTIVGSIDMLASQRVYISSDHAYVTGPDTGLQVIDISDPTDPTIVGFVDTPGWALGVYVSGDNAYVAGWGGGLQVIDISDPSNPTIVGSAPMSNNDNAQDVHVLGNYAYVSGGSRGRDDDFGSFAVIDISGPTNPTIVSSVDTPGDAGDVHVSEKNAYVAAGNGGLQVIDVSDPNTIRVVGSVDTPGSARDVHVLGNFAYLIADSSLQVIDIADPTEPTIVGSTDTLSLPREVYVLGGYAYVADGYSGLRVIEISVPNNPNMVSTADTPSVAQGVYVSGNYAYVADHSSGLLVIDISDPPNPTIVGSAVGTSSVYGVYVESNHAYVAAGGGGLQVIDITDPTDPIIVGSVDTPGAADGVYVSGNYAYVSDYAWFSPTASGLPVIDITNPTNPTIVGSVYAPGAVHVSGNYVYVAAGGGGLQILKAFEPCANVAFVDSTTLTATVSAGFSEGTHNLHVVNPNGERATLHNAFFVSTTSCNGDHDLDYDVDGSDLSAAIEDLNSIDLESFAIEFGRNDCF